jgi:hypothetical protein
VPVEPSANEIKHLQREQTEEWKGWMQIMFLLYHYFEASSTYNAIRVYIAAYVWMTGTFQLPPSPPFLSLVRLSLSSPSSFLCVPPPPPPSSCNVQFFH